MSGSEITGDYPRSFSGNRECRGQGLTECSMLIMPFNRRSEEWMILRVERMVISNQQCK